MSYSDLGMKGGAIQQLTVRTNPLDAFNDVFAGFTGGGQMPPSTLMRDKLLVDRVYADYTRPRTNSRLSGTDKQLVDRYVSLVSELQAKLSPTGMPMMSCTPPMAPASMANNTALGTSDITTKWSIFLDIVAAAVMCDRTRVITIGVHKALGPSPD